MGSSPSSGSNEIKQQTEPDSKQKGSVNTNTAESHQYGKTNSCLAISELIKSDAYDKSDESCRNEIEKGDTENNSEKDSKEVEDEDDFMEECIIYPGQDRRDKVYESAYNHHGIIQCIGSLVVRYRDDALTETCETAWGTGTVIHIDSKKRCYVLSAAHNTHQPLRQCSACDKKTLSIKCKCNRKKTKKVSPTQLIEAESIVFQRRCVEGRKYDGYKFGDVIKSYAIDDWTIPDLYKDYTKAYDGYDLCIMTFQCRNEDINIYKFNCRDIELVCDSSFGKNEGNPMCIFGYPGDQDKKNEMWGMATATRKGHKLSISQNNSSGKAYIVNPDIDTTVGQSGAAIWSWCDDMSRRRFAFSQAETTTYRIYGVHTGGFPGSKEHDRQNVGSFFDIENLKWIAQQMKGLRTSIIEPARFVKTSNKETANVSKITYNKSISDENYINNKIDNKYILIYDRLLQMGFSKAEIINRISVYNCKNVNEEIAFNELIDTFTNDTLGLNAGFDGGYDVWKKDVLW